MDTTVSARMDARLKSEAEDVFARLGITHSVAINALYSQVVLQQGLPFAVQIPRKRAEHTIYSIKKAIAPLAERYGIARVSLFGSYARGEETLASDIDLRVDPGKAKGLALGGFQYDAEAALGLKVDVVTTGSLSAAFLESISEEEIVLYER